MDPSRNPVEGYAYGPLQEGEIRLCTLSAGEFEDPIRLKLSIHKLQDATTYQTISYCWGEMKSMEKCICEDKNKVGWLNLSTHLCNGLRRIRMSSSDSVLWADQICMNQNDKVEKSHQVKLMGQIYSQAEKVWVWLDEVNEGTKDAPAVASELDAIYLEFERKAGEQEEEEEEGKEYLDDSDMFLLEMVQTVLSRISQSENGPRYYQSVQNLLESTWFERVWTFQEFVLSRQVTFLLGPHQIQSSMLDNACRAIAAVNMWEAMTGQKVVRRLSSKDVPLQLLTECQRARDSDDISARPHKSPLDIMKRTMELQCQMPADKVYGMLGLFNDLNPQDFPVDYALPLKQVYAHITRFCFQSCTDLAFLQMISPYSAADVTKLGQHPEAPLELPSWVPDYRSSFGVKMRLGYGERQGILHGIDRRYNATGNSEAKLLPSSELQLAVEGILIGCITTTTESVGCHHPTRGIHPGLEVGGSWHQFLLDHMRYGGNQFINESVDEAFARLRISDYLREEVDSELRRQRTMSAEDFPAPSNPLSVGEHPNYMTMQIYEATRFKRLYWTDTGFFGTVHESCREGDEVWLLMGSDMPCVLRRLEDGTFHFVDLSYVHGIMYGEYLVKNFKGGHTMSDGAWIMSLSKRPLPFETKTVVLS